MRERVRVHAVDGRVQDNQPLSLALVRHRGHHANPLARAQDLVYFVFDFLVRNHLATDLTETRQAIRDGDEAVVVVLGQIAGHVPAVPDGRAR